MNVSVRAYHAACSIRGYNGRPHHQHRFAREDDGYGLPALGRRKARVVELVKVSRVLSKAHAIPHDGAKKSEILDRTLHMAAVAVQAVERDYFRAQCDRCALARLEVFDGFGCGNFLPIS